MKQMWMAGAIAAAAAGLTVTLSATPSPIALIGVGSVPGTDLDLSGLNEATICKAGTTTPNATDCISQALLGGFGSGTTYTGHDNVFLAVPDRGPFDGRTTVPFADRFHFFRFDIDTTKNPADGVRNITSTLLDTRFLKNEFEQAFVGDAYAFDTVNPQFTRRLDPEGVVVDGQGNFIVSDEYGPYLFRFDRQGNLLQRIDVPEAFQIDHPSGDVDGGGNSVELQPFNAGTGIGNNKGRQANRGMEGVAITPDGRLLVGIMQNALIQDKGLNASGGRLSKNNRILTTDLVTGERHEYVYVIDSISSGRGVNDLLALNDHEFLVLERDNRTLKPTPPNAAQTPQEKMVYKIDLHTNNLTDVSGMDLPEVLPPTIVPVSKVPFLDLLNPAFQVGPGVTIKDVIAEKVEALSWGPDLADGRHVLYVLTDNDLFAGNPTQIYAFAIDANYAAFVRQSVGGPMFPPGQVKKAGKGTK